MALALPVFFKRIRRLNLHWQSQWHTTLKLSRDKALGVFTGCLVKVSRLVPVALGRVAVGPPGTRGTGQPVKRLSFCRGILHTEFTRMDGNQQAARRVR